MQLLISDANILIDLEEGRLLTGDMTLRKTADKEAMIVKGTLWVVEQMVVHEIITKEQALEAYDLMKSAGRRLPWPVAIRQLNDI